MIQKKFLASVDTAQWLAELAARSDMPEADVLRDLICSAHAASERAVGAPIAEHDELLNRRALRIRMHIGIEKAETP